MEERIYDREKAVAYARRWALGRNPAYLNFSGIGGDCANFASQCLYAGAGIMNHKPLYGWYYNSASDRTPAWSSVKYLYKFLVSNKGAGPYASEIPLEDIKPGDIIQIATRMEDFHHTLVVSEKGPGSGYEGVFICAHSFDSLDRPLSTYDIKKIRCLHVEGVRL